jgi:lysozyme
MDGDDLLIILLGGAGLTALYFLSNQKQATLSVPASPQPTTSPEPQYYQPQPTTQTQPVYAPQPEPVSPMISANMVSQNGEEFIKNNEGLKLTPYSDLGQHGGHDIGYGHYFAPGASVPTSITQQEADAYFAEDIQTVENDINSLVTVSLNQNQYDALADFVYTIGQPKFSSSTLLKLLNQGDYSGAAQQFMVWRLPPSIIGRRQKEMTLFNSSWQIA